MCNEQSREKSLCRNQNQARYEMSNETGGGKYGPGIRERKGAFYGKTLRTALFGEWLGELEKKGGPARMSERAEKKKEGKYNK